MIRLLLAGVLALAVSELQAGAPPWAGHWKPNVVYAERNDGDLKLDIYYPSTPPPPQGYPVILSLHGGGWIIGHRRRELFLHSLVKEGYVLVSPQYRLSYRAKFPAQIEDVRAAAHWLLKNARELQLDPHRVVATGASAGGHLALLLAMSADKVLAPGGTPPLPRHFIKAVCAFYPVTDLERIIRPEKRDDPDNLVARLLGGPVAEKSALAKLGSPSSHVGKDSPPVYFIHGDQDLLVPLSQSTELQKQLRRAGVETKLVIRQGRGHAFAPSPAQVEDVAAFFKRRLDD